MRYKARICFDGTGYSGWQVQPRASTVQGEIEHILRQLYQQDIAVTGCGRTDAGVHARTFYIHFDVPTEVFSRAELLYKMNKMTPSSIAFQQIDVSPLFHARFDAISRQYVYALHSIKDPFLHHYSYYYPRTAVIDLNSLNATASLLLNYDDFASFCKSKSDVKTTKCKLSKSSWVRDQSSGLHFHIAADRFLRGMVRLIVGAMLLIEEGQLTRKELIDALETKKRLVKNWSVPACGLSLTGVDYPQ